jgi:hypothetical protein
MKKPSIGMLLILSLWMSFAADVSFAHIPPGEFVVRNLAQKKLPFRSIRVKTQVAALGDTSPSGLSFRETTWFDASTGTVRSRAFDEAGRELFSIERKLSAEEVKLSPATRMIRLLFSSNSINLQRELVAAGIPVQAETEQKPSLLRWRETVAWVFGGPQRSAEEKIAIRTGSPASATRPELWIEKDTFLPLRIVAQVGTQWLDATFEGYRFYKDFPFPKTIRLSRDGLPMIQVDQQEVAVGADVASELKKPLNVGQTGGLTAAGQAASEEIRSLIQMYYEWMR